MGNREWRAEQKHLPEFMRDFHNCKDLFKTIDKFIVCDEGHPANDISWVQAHCCTIDVFLWFMAMHGYTLQRCRAKVPFDDIGERIMQMKQERKELIDNSLGLTSKP